MDQIIIDITSTATIAIAVFGIVFSLMQTKYSCVSQSFAMFLAAVAVNNIPDAFGRILQSLPNKSVQLAELIIWIPSGLCLAPLFWVYVFTLTAPTQEWPPHLYRHFVLPGIAVLVGVITSIAPQDISSIMFDEATFPLSGGSLALIVVFVLLQLALFPQIAFYLFLIIRRLMRHRTMLRDVYASTEEHELRWIYVIGGLGALFWMAIVLIQFLAFDPENAEALSVVLGLAGLSGLAMVATTTLWGLRQRPPLMPDIDVAEPPDMPETLASERPVEKYEKSALSPEASARIARKLRAAMEQDNLHRDPNLSLWVLARHVGASPNYVSQTLSEVIGESFFEFVNGYRIIEAKALLAKTEDTVLAITYEVGFNARSSFYKAFKRVTGQTPANYRKTMSQPVGTDDKGALIGET